MNYNKRVDITTKVTTPGYLGDDVVENKTVTVPCNEASLSNNEQIGVFGKYNQKAFKLHIQGVHKSFDKIKYDGVIRSVYLTKYHRNSTVVIVT